MKHYLRTPALLILIAILAFASPVSVLADEGEDGHGLEVEINGYHVTLASQNEWVKGENLVIVTITDKMGMPVSNAEVEILIAPRASSHAESEPDSHGGSETDAHGEPAADKHESKPSSHDTMSEADAHEEESSEVMAHDEETVAPLVMKKEHGQYIVETHIEKAGAHDVQVFFHVDGEMTQADFTVDVSGMESKTVVLWSFLLINVGLVVSAGVLKTQSITVKGK